MKKLCLIPDIESEIFYHSVMKKIIPDTIAVMILFCEAVAPLVISKKRQVVLNSQHRCALSMQNQPSSQSSSIVQFNVTLPLSSNKVALKRMPSSVELEVGDFVESAESTVGADGMMAAVGTGAAVVGEAVTGAVVGPFGDFDFLGALVTSLGDFVALALGSFGSFVSFASFASFANLERCLIVFLSPF